MAGVEVGGDPAFTADEEKRLGDWDRKFRSLPLVWGQAISDPDGVVVGFVTCNGEMWRAEALLFDGEYYSERPVGYHKDEAAVSAVLSLPDHVHSDYESHEAFHALRGHDAA